MFGDLIKKGRKCKVNIIMMDEGKDSSVKRLGELKTGDNCLENKKEEVEDEIYIETLDGR